MESSANQNPFLQALESKTSPEMFSALQAAYRFRLRTSNKLFLFETCKHDFENADPLSRNALSEHADAFCKIAFDNDVYEQAVAYLEIVRLFGFCYDLKNIPPMSVLSFDGQPSFETISLSYAFQCLENNELLQAVVRNTCLAHKTPFSDFQTAYEDAVRAYFFAGRLLAVSMYY